MPETRTGRRIVAISIVISATLAVVKITLGLLGGSTAVVADGVESAADVGTSSLVLVGLLVASRPADQNHPYGHGRFETLTGLLIGLVLMLTGVVICIQSWRTLTEVHEVPAFYTIWPLIGSVLVKAGLSTLKFRYGRRINSSALIADGWNDLVDILSGTAALTALALTLYGGERFLAADHFGGFAVGLVVIFSGLRVVRDTAVRLSDAMPSDEKMEQIRRCAMQVPGVRGVEKCFARNTGFQYHVDLHLEVDPEMTVRASHEIATEVRFAIRRELDWVADVLVHVEPAP